MQRKKPIKTINFLESYPADTAIIGGLIAHLQNDLFAMTFPQREIDEIIISVDEALTNAIQETLRRQCDSAAPTRERTREITIRYRITRKSFDATVIDHGGGLNILTSIEQSPNSTMPNYSGQIMRYMTESEQKKLRITRNGRKIALRGIGAGLKILLAFMDSITIDFIDRKKVISTDITSFTDGTILNMRRKRRY